MPCKASGMVVDPNTLTVLKNGEALPERMVSANKHSVTKFVCPEAECGKSVDVTFRKDGMARIREHAARGEKISMVGGTRKVVVGPVTLTGLVELQKKQQEIFAAQMSAALTQAEDVIKSADAKIEAQLALIKQAETRIEEIKRDKALAGEIVGNPEYAQYRKAV